MAKCEGEVDQLVLIAMQPACADLGQQGDPCARIFFLGVRSTWILLCMRFKMLGNLPKPEQIGFDFPVALPKSKPQQNQKICVKFTFIMCALIICSTYKYA